MFRVQELLASFWLFTLLNIKMIIPRALLAVYDFFSSDTLQNESFEAYNFAPVPDRFIIAITPFRIATATRVSSVNALSELKFSFLVYRVQSVIIDNIVM
jgi:hypothetical protein